MPAPTGLPKPDDLGRGKDTLAADVAAFASQLLEKHAKRFRRRPVAIKKRILKLLATQLPPYPRPAGRKPSENVTCASRLYSGNITLKSPFNGSLTFGTTKYLASLERSGTGGLTHTLTYGTNDSGELTKVQFPHGGELQWTYRNFTYTGSRRFREVQDRKLKMTNTGTTHTYPLTRDDAGDAGKSTHACTKLDDAGGIGRKQWFFETNTASAYFGRPTQFDEIALPSTVKRRGQYTYATTAGGVKYVSSELSTIDVGAAYQKQSKVEQDVNDYGLTTERRVYDFGSGTTPSSTVTATYRTTYVTDTNYTSRYMRNLVLWADMQLAGGSWRDTVDNTYDDYSGANTLVSRTGLRQHDSANYGTGVVYRGNPTLVKRYPEGIEATHRYDITGMVEKATQGATSVQVTPSQNNAVPYQITPNGNSSLASTMSWNTFLGLTQETGPNGASASYGYDTWGRPTSVTSPHGAVTNTTYSTGGTYPATTTTTINNSGAGGNGRWTKTTVDGFGRAVKVESGYSTTTVSVAETTYAPCACSPLGKVSAVSRPYAPGGTVYWTTYTYDALGRTTNVTLPSSMGTTTYLYEGNTVKTTDAAGKWKKFTMNAFGQLAQVNEPNPAGGADLVTTYTYDIWGNLVGVSMPRGSTTQTRTFTYNNRGKLTGTTLPENGTTTFTYNTDFTLASKTDAKNQKITYTYDTYKRLTEVKRFTVASDPGSEDLTQRVTHYYDSNPFDGSFTQNGAGRRTATVYYMRRSGYSPPNPLNGQIIEMYSYSTGGLLTKKRFTAVLQNPVDTYNNVSNYTDVEYTYDSEGRRTQMVYPKGRYRDTGSHGAPWMQDASRTLNYTYDSMGRIHTMAEPSPGPSWVSGVTYNAASQPTNFSGLGETRTYNILGQLTQITAGSSFSERYDYAATQNNGRITGKKNLLSGEEVQYAYDSLQRLQSAITVTDPLVTQWGQNFSYDGWGNLLGASVAKGSAPTFSVTVNGLTNRINGSSYDANGNQAVTGSSYDVENRLKGAGTYPNYYQYTYDGSNKRVAKSVPLLWDTENGTVSGEELLMFYGAGGERLAEFTMSIVKFGTPSQWYLRFTEKKTLVWFGSKLLRDGKYAVIQDRLGSVRWRRDTTNNQTETADYYPYGQEKPSATTNDREKFATYLRDPESGLDYADQRYHNPGWGRFLTADPYQASAGPGDPGSWNRYAYVEGDPVNGVDPRGLYFEVPGLNLDFGMIWNSGQSGPIGCMHDPIGSNFWSGGLFCLMPVPAMLAAMPPPDPPLECKFTGAEVGKPGWGTTQRGFGFHMPVSFGFSATGGNGQYTWTNTQKVHLEGSVTWSDGFSFSTPRGGVDLLPPESIRGPKNGSNAVFLDEPGWAMTRRDSSGTPKGRVVSLNMRWTMMLQVTVESGGQKVNCPAVSWEASLNWTTVDGVPNATGEVTVKTKP